MEKTYPRGEKLLNTIFTETKPNKLKALCCCGTGTYMIYFLKSKGMVNTKYRIAVTGDRGQKKWGMG